LVEKMEERVKVRDVMFFKCGMGYGLLSTPYNYYSYSDYILLFALRSREAREDH
jgi:hypothetical protein